MSGKHLFLSLEQTETIHTPNNEQQIQQVQHHNSISLNLFLSFKTNRNHIC